MNFRTTKVLLILLTVGLIFVFIAKFSESTAPKPDEDVAGRSVFAADSDKIESFTITPASGQAIEIVRQPDPSRFAAGRTIWKIVRPIEWRANATTTSQLITALTG